MGNKVTFDYSKASTFVAKHEVDYMNKLPNGVRIEQLRQMIMDAQFSYK